MKKRSPSRRKLQLNRTTIRQLSSRRLAAINGGDDTFTFQPQGGDDSVTLAECILTNQASCVTN